MHRVLPILLSALLIAHMSGPPGIARAENQDVLPGSEAIIGGEQTYMVTKGDDIRLIAAQLGVSWRRLARENGLDPYTAVLRPGRELRFNNRKIIPKTLADGILINIPDRTLYLFRDRQVMMTAPLTLGLPKGAESSGQDRRAVRRHWQTPTGSFIITAKYRNPAWNVPPSIQEEMRQNGDEVLLTVAPGKKNPLGRYALRTSLGRIMLHSTNTPRSIYGFGSHGCIRVYPEKMQDLFYNVDLRTRGEIIYMPVKLAVTADRRVFLEVHRDIYHKVKDLREEVRRLADQQAAAALVDWEGVGRVLREKSGIAEDVTRTSPSIVGSAVRYDIQAPRF